NRELEVAEWAAKGKYGLARMELRGVAPGHCGQVVRIDLDDGEVGQFVGADDLSREYAAIMQSDLDLRGAVDDVIVSNDIAIGGDDDSTSNAMLQRLLLGCYVASATGVAEKL